MSWTDSQYGEMKSCEPCPYENYLIDSFGNAQRYTCPIIEGDADYVPPSNYTEPDFTLPSTIYPYYEDDSIALSRFLPILTVLAAVTINFWNLLIKGDSYLYYKAIEYISS